MTLRGGAVRRAPKTYDELTALLRREFERLTASQRRIARFVMREPDVCAFLTISELAAAAGVDESTVSRFATRLGLAGYSSLVALCRTRLREDAGLVRRFDSLALDEPGEGRPFADVIANDQRNIAKTLGRIPAESWNGAVATAAGARAIYVVGLRLSRTVSYLLAYLLGMVRDRVVHADSSAGRLPDCLREIGEGDCLIAVAIHPYPRDTVAALRFARHRRAATIALTDEGPSPLARNATLSLYVETSGVSIMRSLVAFTSLVETLASAVAVRLGPTARVTLAAQERLLREFDVYERMEDEPLTYFRSLGDR